MSWLRLFFAAVIGVSLVSGAGAVQAQPRPRQLGAPAAALGTGFTFQGQLTTGAGPVTSTCDFQFGLYDAASLGSQVGVTQTVSAVSVAGSLFTVVLNGSGQFGGRAFDGSGRWLALAVKCPPDSAFTPLAPRQALTAAPYALALPGLRTEQNLTSTNVIGGYIGNSVNSGAVGATIGGGGVNGAINIVSADYGTVGGGNANTASGSSATVGGGAIDSASGAFATVGGGSLNSAGGSFGLAGGGYFNSASGDYATVSGGSSNKASATDSVVGGGVGNVASGAGATVGGGGTNGTAYASNRALAYASTIGGGFGNVISPTAHYATVGGGSNNAAVSLLGVDYQTVAGGRNNTASDDSTTVGGGYNNTASSAFATVGGGASNTASGPSATIAGGTNNTASGNAAVVAGGDHNTASGSGSFAAGRQARAVNPGAFVWADSSANPITSTAGNQFLVRASGGITLYTNAGATSGAALYPGSGSWNILSDRNMKANFASVDGLDILNALAGVPIQTWNYTTQDAGIRHIGPIAQDFRAAFGVGENATTISTVDAQGVALAAIQGLYTLVQEKDAQIVALRDANTKQQTELAAQDNRLNEQETRLAAVETRLASGPAQPAVALPWLLLAAVVLLNVGGLAGYTLARARRS